MTPEKPVVEPLSAHHAHPWPCYEADCGIDAPRLDAARTASVAGLDRERLCGFHRDGLFCGLTAGHLRAHRDRRSPVKREAILLALIDEHDANARSGQCDDIGPKALAALGYVPLALREQEPGEARYFEPGCVFCEKATGNPDRVMVFEPLNPVTPGHLLVVPTAHARDATEWPDITAYVMERAAEVARAAGPCNLITSVGHEATQSVFHLHVHVVPRRAGDGLALPWSEQEPGETLRAARNE